VGSTNLFWVTICMITPEMLIAIAAKIGANVRDTRAIKNMLRASASLSNVSTEMS
jgi:hypothetical protein